VDKATTAELKRTGRFSDMPARRDVDEHSLEMHIPYLWKRLEQTFGTDSAKYPPIIPILVGDGTEEQEQAYGQLLAQYLKDPTTAWIISSDFCHWGSRFSYRPVFDNGKIINLDADRKDKHLELRPGWEQLVDNPDNMKIHEVIKMLDKMAMNAVESGAHHKFYHVIQQTQNTVCGRHPIGVIMAALEVLTKDQRPEDGRGKLKFVQYQRSNLVEKVWDFSVSYASAYAIV
jgi:Predicted dioxygenase